MFWKKEPAEISRSYCINVIAQTELDLAVIKELAFLKDVHFVHPLEKKVVGQHRLEENGTVVGVVPVWEYLPAIIGGATLNSKHSRGATGLADLLEVIQTAKDQKIQVRWSKVEEVVEYRNAPTRHVRF